MNQILSTENRNNKNNKRSGGSKDIRSVAKFFAIAIFIFGIILIGTSSFAILKNESTKQEQARKNSTKPSIKIEMKGEDELIITVIHEEAEIDNVVYYWENGNKTTIDGQGTKYVQKIIEIPTGVNTLYVSATDVNGNTTEFTKDYELAGDVKIDIAQSGNNVKVTVNGKNELASIKYRWDNEEEKTVEVKEKQYALEVEALVGEHTLYVTAIDSQNNKQDKSIKVIGTTKPTLKIEKGDNCYVITAHDDIALEKIEITTVSDGKVTTIESDGKDFSYKYPLKDGDENYIRVTAYNTQGVQSKVIGAKWKK